MTADGEKGAVDRALADIDLMAVYIRGRAAALAECYGVKDSAGFVCAFVAFVAELFLVRLPERDPGLFAQLVESLAVLQRQGVDVSAGVGGLPYPDEDTLARVDALARRMGLTDQEFAYFHRDPCKPESA